MNIEESKSAIVLIEFQNQWCHGRSPRDPPMAVTNIPPSRKYLESIRSFSQICLHFLGSMKISLIKQPIEGIR